MKKNVETELKLLIDKKDLKKLLASDLLQSVIRKSSDRTVQMCSSYYDTADLNLKNNGIAYRVRDKGDGSFEATVKTSQKNSSGLSERLELNMPLPDDQVVLTGFKDLGLGFELTELAPAGVEKLFATEIVRTTYLLDLPQAVAELAVDNGYIRRERAKDRIDEIEIELLEGDKGALLDFAAKIAEQVPVFIEKRSKFARGLELAGIAASEPRLKSRMNGAKNMRQEILKMAQVHGDNILVLQNSMRREFTKSNAKDMLKELLYLRSYVSFGKAFSETDALQQTETCINQLLQNLREILLLGKLQRLWQEIINAKGQLFDKSVLSSRLQLLIEEKQSALSAQLHQGCLSAVVFKIISWLYNTNWENEEYLQTESTVRCRLQEWQDEFSAQEDDAIRWLIAENAAYIVKSMQDREMFKPVLKTKKFAAAALEARKVMLNAMLRSLGHGSNSRVLSRDIGILTGWLLAKNKL